MNFDAPVVFVTKFSLLFRFALAIMWLLVHTNLVGNIK